MTEPRGIDTGPTPKSSSEAEQSLCPFCVIEDAEAIISTDLVRAFWDRYPVSPGHALITTRRHTPDWFSANDEERVAILAALDAVRREVERHHAPDGYNFGVNSGAAAGQTIPHLHFHVIPRYRGDVPDPRGGIRFVIPAKANYLDGPAQAGAPHARPLVRGGDDPLLPHLVAHLATAHHVDIAVAFARASGVRLLIEHLRDVIARGGRVRVLTGDYLDLTEPEALRLLFDIDEGLELRVFESAGTSFHPKSYICVDADGTGTAFVGSSNLSRSALRDGVEWNYRVVTSRDGAGFEAVRHDFESLFIDQRTRCIDAAWVEAYELGRAKPEPPAFAGFAPEQPLPVPMPHEIQREALDALARTRQLGNQAGLVVLATGLGKTWLAAFDTEKAKAHRVLFVAHRDEILDQALRTFRAIRPKAALGKYTGTEKVSNAHVVFASIQTLGRRAHLERFEPEAFDYLVVDEFHHASAATYRRLLDHFTPQFLLGLTATPERADGADLLALCDENLVYQADLAEGIRRGLLSPFDYFGVPDEVDYAQIPWRSSRFEEEALTTAVATTSRADNALEQLRRRGGTRTLAFCVSQRHADFMRQHFRANGLRVAAVHAGPTSDPRTRSLERLQAGELDILFAVDMFNEGVDIPDVDTVLMLRPTESPVLWRQQFGRGLRYRLGKRLKVLDYIGNHRTFLLKPKTLFQLDGGDAQLSYALKLLDEGRVQELLPPGCSVTYDLEAKEILRALLKPGSDGLLNFYRDFRDRTGFRPTASEVFHALYDPKSVRRGYGSWFQFVRTMGDLTGALDSAEVHLRDFLMAVEITPMTRSFKMVVLLAMLAEGAFPGSIDVNRLARRVRTLARRSGNLRQDFGDALEDDAKLISLLEENPITAWVEGKGTGGERYFKYEGGVFSTTIALEESLHEPAAVLVRELAEWRLAVYLRRTSNENGADRIICRVSHANGRPILFLPDRDRVAAVPEGWVDVTADGQRYHARFAKVAVNVLQRASDDANVIADVLRGWFGANAGQPGTAQFVEFARAGGEYVLAPVTDGEAARNGGPELWQRYPRAEVPKLFGFEFKGFESQSGVVERDGIILLFVTLDKTGKPQEHRYEDAFVSPNEFRWQSQNRTNRDSEAGRRISEHKDRGIGIHLFVRPVAKSRNATQPFTYCGPLTFERWEGDNPITVWWRLGTAVPVEARAWLRVPSRAVPPG